MATSLPAATAFTGSTVQEGQFKQAMTDLRAFLNDPDSYQWYAPGLAPTYVSATSFTLVGNQTAAFHVGRRIRAVVTAGTVYGVIKTSVFGAVTTITVVLDSGALDSGLSTVYFGVMTAVNSGALLGIGFAARKTAVAQSIPNAVATLVTFPTEDFDTLGNYSSNRFTPTQAGTYSIKASVLFGDTHATGTFSVTIYRNGSAVNGTSRTIITTGGLQYSSLQADGDLIANGTTDYFEIYVTQSTGAAVNISGNTVENYFSAHKVI